MASPTKTTAIFKVAQIAFSAFGLYLVFSLFELWSYVPFWLKNLALVVIIGGVYCFSRKILKTPLRQNNQVVLNFVSLGVLALVGLGVYSAGPALPGRLAQAVTFSLNQPPTEVLLTLEVLPPEHTGKEARVLVAEKDGPFSRQTFEKAGPFPEGSLITLKLSMVENITPVVSLGNSWTRVQKREKNEFEASLVLLENATLNIQAGPYVSLNQKFEVSPDKSPEIEFSSVAQVTPRNSIKLEAGFSDDYGVEEIFLELHGGPLEDSIFNLPFSKRRPGEARETFFINLLSDIRAGSTVTAKLIAIDGLGQKAESRPMTLELPEKNFENELAANLVDIRKALLENPARVNAQLHRLARYSEDPEAFGNNKGVYLALRSAYWRLRSAENREDIEEISRFLWQTALTLEGDGSYEEQVLRSLLEDMTRTAFMGGDVRPFEQQAIKLRAKARSLFNQEFGHTRRRFSFNAGVQGFEIPQVKRFRELTGILEIQAAENDRQAVLETLLESRALFEGMSTPKNGRRTTSIP